MKKLLTAALLLNFCASHPAYVPDQKKEAPVEDRREIMIQEHVNENLKAKLDDAAYNLAQCRIAVADPKNGGDGTIVHVEDYDRLRPENMDKMSAERKYEENIRNALKEVQRQNEECVQQKSRFTQQ